MNDYERRMEELSRVRRRWKESEWLLNHLRTLSSTQTKQLTDEELLTWNRRPNSTNRTN